MDFLKILKSFEEFVYEALTWLILLPRTLVRIVLSPGQMTDYASAQMVSPDDNRFSEAISPPLLLILCVVIAHFIDVGIRGPVPVVAGSLAHALLASEENLLLYRTIAFGVWALAGAVYLLSRTGRAVNRETLRVPFYEQCYLVTPFALLVSLSVSLTLLQQPWANIAAGVLPVAGGVWFWFAQAAWLRRRAGFVVWQSMLGATVVLLVGAVVNAGVGHLLSHSYRAPAATTTAADK